MTPPDAACFLGNPFAARCTQRRPLTLLICASIVDAGFSVRRRFSVILAASVSRDILRCPVPCRPPVLTTTVVLPLASSPGCEGHPDWLLVTTLDYNLYLSFRPLAYRTTINILLSLRELTTTYLFTYVRS